MGPRFESVKVHHGPLVKWLRQRPLTPLTSVRIRYGSPAVLKKQLTGSTGCARIKRLEAGRLLTINDGGKRHPYELVLIAVRVHLFPSRTQKLSSQAPTILGGWLPGKIGNANIRKAPSDWMELYIMLKKELYKSIRRRISWPERTDANFIFYKEIRYNNTNS